MERQKRAALGRWCRSRRVAPDRLPLSMNAGVEQISWWGIGLSLLPVIAVAWVFHRWNSGGWLLGYATFRMLVQLVAVGFVLVFVFENESAWLGVGILVMVLGVSSWIALRPLQDKGPSQYGLILFSLTVSGVSVLALVLWGVIGLDPMYQPRYFIPLTGMIFANAMNAISLAGERFEMERRSQNYQTSRSAAFNAAMIPQINSFLAVGLVALPGMMTGQILSGVSPLEAVRYQIVVMNMILGSAGLAVAIYLRGQPDKE